MNTFHKIGFMIAFSLFIMGCFSTVPNTSEQSFEAIVMEALKTAQLGQTLRRKDPETKDPETGNEYEITPVRKFSNESGQTCYEYEAVMTNLSGEQREMTGKACHQSNGSWNAIKQ